MKKVKKLYNNLSKHSQYQSFPFFDLGEVSNPKINTQEEQRYAFMSKFLDFKNRSVVDVGANTGYFSFSAKQSGASQVIAFEGNKEHAEFLVEANKILDLDIKVENEYFTPSPSSPKADIYICLNVVHHLGDDFLQGVQKEDAKKLMKDYIHNVCSLSKFSVFQLGFCWKGNTELPLFSSGTKEEMISFVKDALPKNSILDIGILDKNNIYTTPDKSNMLRYDELGEFANRPLFIVKNSQRDL